MSFKGGVAKVMVLAAVAVFFLNGTFALAYDPDKFPGKGSRADWERACALCRQGVTLAKEGRHLEAQELWTRSLAVYPMAASYFNFATDLKRSGKSQASIALYEKAIALAPDYYQAYVNLADAYLILHEFAKAEDSCRKALQINPKTAGAMINLAEACMGTARFSDARKWLDQASKCPDAELPNFKSALRANYERLRLLSKDKHKAS